MGIRRRARELAMQALFFMDMRPDSIGQDQLGLFCRSCPPPRRSLPLFTELVEGVRGHCGQIDGIIERFSSNWKVRRMGGVDRNVIRVAVYEMLARGDIPAKVSINEAIDIGKKYGTDESGAFINGILDAIHLAIEKEGLTLTEAPPAPDRFPKAADEPPPVPPPPEETVLRTKVRQDLIRRRTKS